LIDINDLKGKEILLTGHTGFKGAWLGAWLTQIGARVHGVSLQPEPGPSLFTLLGKSAYYKSHFQDIRDFATVEKLVNKICPDVVFHLAAQALVRPSYSDPLKSFSTNIMGTANILEACRNMHRPPVIVCITTDKVYLNDEAGQTFCETDPIGGKDPYSASKAGAEMVVKSYDTLFKLEGTTRPYLAIARGGNVIGGGDWSLDRIVPDGVRAATSGSSLRIRSPDAVRPWQHVLELCHAYMTLAAGLLSDNPVQFEGAWNFGPDPKYIVTVYELAKKLANELKYPFFIEADTEPSVPEANYLTLDISKAKNEIQWTPALSVDKGIALTGEWYAAFMQDPMLAKDLTFSQITYYETLR